MLDDGRHISREADNVPGFPGMPMQRADVERKFRGNVGKRWPAERTASILEAMWSLERTPDVGALLASLTLPAER
jgi:2-methylcitrate dehydratase